MGQVSVLHAGANGQGGPGLYRLASPPNPRREDIAGASVRFGESTNGVRDSRIGCLNLFHWPGPSCATLLADKLLEPLAPVVAAKSALRAFHICKHSGILSSTLLQVNPSRATKRGSAYTTAPGSPGASGLVHTVLVPFPRCESVEALDVCEVHAVVLACGGLCDHAGKGPPGQPAGHLPRDLLLSPSHGFRPMITHGTHGPLSSSFLAARHSSGFSTSRVPFFVSTR